MIFTAAVAILVAVSLVPGSSQCSCPSARGGNGWCQPCGIGYLASLPVRSKDIFDIVHPHGHHANQATLTCVACRKAVLDDGFCERSGIGFVDNEAYFSKLAYYVAKGRPIDVDEIDCAVCTKLVGHYRHPKPENQAETPGWCESCMAGYFGNFVYCDREEFEAASAEFQLLLRAVETTKRCQSCATAMLCEGRCPECNISYHLGRPVAVEREAPQRD